MATDTSAKRLGLWTTFRMTDGWKITAWSDGGTTSEPNLAATCTHHHRLKTHAEGWHVHAHPDGRLTWTTPTGHQHTTAPHDYRPDAPAEPAAAPEQAPPVPDGLDSDLPPF